MVTLGWYMEPSGPHARAERCDYFTGRAAATSSLGACNRLIEVASQDPRPDARSLTVELFTWESGAEKTYVDPSKVNLEGVGGPVRKSPHSAQCSRAFVSLE